MNSLHGKVALVTGGSRGIGAATALRLARDGADVALSYQQDKGQAERVAGGIEELGRRAWTVRADMAEATDVTAMVDGAVAELGRLDILVNNAGLGVLGPVEELPLADVDRVFAVNVRGAYLAAQAAARHLADGGRLIHIGSCVTQRVPFPGASLYAASKSALTGLSKALARELAARGTTSNVVHPGPIDTDMNPADGPDAAAQRGFTALGRHGQPDEIAATVAHLAGDGGRYVTGASIAVDGGHAA
ncbi:SDR family NAD(P)-dependent oxidoreductase [Streptomyces oceani]|uniref:Oxidoreductase n=1 Tax=Streptomyces oceani TaxID=1075402 RepID=A0A1E7KJI8_9ACTN|nr:SDR family oxidoreductase [Streptomyces oceani]OEV04075.1 oxidoreductase [Streptomyces oceani]